MERPVEWVDSLPENGSDVNIYVQRATLNGEAIHRAYIRHAEMADGGRLVLEMGPQPSAWGQRQLTPSYPSGASGR